MQSPDNPVLFIYHAATFMKRELQLLRAKGPAGHLPEECTERGEDINLSIEYPGLPSHSVA
jgi:hypothetical protein